MDVWVILINLFQLSLWFGLCHFRYFSDLAIARSRLCWMTLGESCLTQLRVLFDSIKSHAAAHLWVTHCKTRSRVFLFSQLTKPRVIFLSICMIFSRLAEEQSVYKRPEETPVCQLLSSRFFITLLLRASSSRSSKPSVSLVTLGATNIQCCEPFGFWELH